jgi:hypothetical protein
MPGEVETGRRLFRLEEERETSRRRRENIQGKVAQSICQTAADYDIHHRQSRALDCTDDARNPGSKKKERKTEKEEKKREEKKECFPIH